MNMYLIKILKWVVFCLLNLKKQKEADLTKEEILNSSKPEIDIGSTPLSEFNTPYLASLAFPTLFPDTKGDPTNPAIVREISRSETESFFWKVKAFD